MSRALPPAGPDDHYSFDFVHVELDVPLGTVRADFVLIGALRVDKSAATEPPAFVWEPAQQTRNKISCVVAVIDKPTDDTAAEQHSPLSS